MIYKAKCGHGIETDNPLFDEISCMLVGCEACKNNDGNNYYSRDIKKGVGLWAGYKLKEMREDGNK